MSLRHINGNLYGFDPQETQVRLSDEEVCRNPDNIKNGNKALQKRAEEIETLNGLEILRKQCRMNPILMMEIE